MHVYRTIRFITGYVNFCATCYAIFFLYTTKLKILHFRIKINKDICFLTNLKLKFVCMYYYSKLNKTFYFAYIGIFLSFSIFSSKCLSESNNVYFLLSGKLVRINTQFLRKCVDKSFVFNIIAQC